MRIRMRGFGFALAMSCLVCNAVSGAPAPTPLRPDLNGLWFSFTGAAPLAFNVEKAADGSILASQTKESSGVVSQAFRPTQDPPQYKPEFQARLKEMQSQNLNRLDNVFVCGQPGLPRVGAPQQIIQLPNQIVFHYADLNGMVFRVIPLDGRPHRDTDPSFYGVSVGHWEGDTLVVDARNFSTTTWIGEEGFFHSDQMRVIERFRRVGDTIEYNVTVEDPGVLAKPWVKPAKIMRKTDVPLEEPFPCDYTNLEGLDEPRHDQRSK